MSIAKTRMACRMSGRRSFYAPKGVKIEEGEDAWVLASDNYRRMDELWECCHIVRDSGIDNAGKEFHAAFFNHPIAMSFNENDSEARFILMNWRNCDGDYGGCRHEV